MWDVLRCYVKETPKLKPPKANSPAATILAKEPQLEAVWTQQPGSQSGKRVTGKATFVAPPQSHWGPKVHTNIDAVELLMFALLLIPATWRSIL